MKLDSKNQTFLGPQCEVQAESLVVLLSLWGIIILGIFAGAGVCIYKFVARKRETQMYHINSDSKDTTMLNWCLQVKINCEKMFDHWNFIKVR